MGVMVQNNVAHVFLARCVELHVSALTWLIDRR